MAKPLKDVESHILKKDFLEAYKANGGFSYAAAKTVGIDYTTAHYWMTHDNEYAEQLRIVKEQVLDRAEAELYTRAINVKERDTCLIFLLKTKGKDRGYVERIETTGKNGAPIQNETTEYKVNEADSDLKERMKLVMKAEIIAEYEESKRNNVKE